jgi:hypothetical protein
MTAYGDPISAASAAVLSGRVRLNCPPRLGLYSQPRDSASLNGGRESSPLPSVPHGTPRAALTCAVAVGGRQRGGAEAPRSR